MPTGSLKNHALKKLSVFILSLLVSFVLIFGVACLIAYISYRQATQNSIYSNETRANLLAKLILEHQRAALGILRSYSSGHLLINAVKRKDFQETSKYLKELVKNDPEIWWTFISNPDGTVWVNFPVDVQVMNKDASNRDWYKGVSREWKPYISRVYKMAAGEKDIAVSVSVPVFDEKGTVIGILRTAQSTALFRKMISNIGFNLDSKITLVDQEGNIICSNRFPYTKEVTSYPPFEFVKTTLEGGKGNVTIRDSSDGGKVKYISFSPVEGIGWSVIVEKGRDELLRSELSYLILISATSVSMFIIAVFSLMYLRDKYRKLVALKQLAEELTIINERCRTEINERKLAEDALLGAQERLRSFSAQRLIAQEQERRRVATEVHDSIGSALAAVKFKLDSTIKQMEAGSLARESMKDLLPTVQQAIEESRRIQSSLRPSILDDLGILPTIEWHCREYQKMYPHIHIEKQINLTEDEVPNSLKTVIYRISQEALNNIAKHGKATLVKFSLQAAEETIELTIQDDGQGFDLSETLSKEKFPKRGLGLSSMRERAELSDGTFHIESAIGKGTTVRISWPTQKVKER